MLFLLVLAVALLTVRAAGGSFQVLAGLSLRSPWLVVVALLLQVLTISVLVSPPHLLAAGLHLLSYGLAGAFLWRNRSLGGLPLAALGGGLNLLAIAANGGTMPASLAARHLAGIVDDPTHFANSAALAAPRLLPLGDVFAVPRAAGPLANVFSPGDLLLAAGAVWLLHAAAGCAWALPRRSRPRATPTGTGTDTPVPALPLP